MYLNDRLGDCTCAAVGHLLQGWTEYSTGTAFTVDDNTVLSLYENAAGYRPDDPSTDQGAYVQDILGYWRKNGVSGHKILAYASLDAADMTEIKQGVALFGALDIGFTFPAFAMDQFDSGKPWDVQKRNAGVEGGHCVTVVGYKANGNLVCITWGQVQEMTPAFWKKYVDEAWVILTQDWIAANGSAPSGVDLYSLGEDFTVLTGEDNPIPEPTPEPEPTPDPEPAPAPEPDPAVDSNVLAAFHALQVWAQENHAA
jgi:hypothetical protein